jgi:hypothetical protein
MKTQRLFFRASPEDLEVLRSVADTLGLAVSQAIFTVLREKRRELGLDVPKATAARSKKQRKSAA